MPDDEADPFPDLPDDPDDLDGPVVLPWSTTASLPALDRIVPCVCDPTAPTSTLRLEDGPDTSTLELRIVTGPLDVTTVVAIEVGEPALLRLGRDILSGRALVDPSSH